jgi:hypothetical protein
MKTLAIVLGSALALFVGSALAAGPPSGHPHGPPGAGPPATPMPNDTSTGESKPYEIPPAWGITVCQDLKHGHGNAFGQCISATVRGLQQPSLPARTACRSLRPRHHASRSAFRACVRAVVSARRSARTARSH